MNLISIRKTFCIVVLVSLFIQKDCFSQTIILKKELLNYTAASDSSNKKFAPEKLYLQFDKPYYAINDTLWFKAYLLNAPYLIPSTKSAILYVDIANDSSKIIKQYRFGVQAGLALGDINLNEKDFLPGTYFLRAYTTWMRNQPDDAFFYKRFYISSPRENNLLVNTNFKTKLVNGIKTADVKMELTDIDKKPYSLKQLQLQLIAGKKPFYKQRLQTDINGLLNVSFNLPQQTSKLAIIAESEQKDKKIFIPLTPNVRENADISFLPEGGSLIAGFPAHIGFKAIGEDGKSVEVTGVVMNSDKKQVATFKSLHKGMGSFDLDIKNNENYVAKVTFPEGTIKLIPLPSVKTTGTVLHIKHNMDEDSVEVALCITNDLIQPGNNYFLIGKSRGIICYAAIINFDKSNCLKRKIPKSLFATGPAHFILMSTKEQPLNERVTFIDHHDNLNIQFENDNEQNAIKDSIAIKIKVTNSEGKPVKGNFSMAVTDDAIVKADSTNSENILSRVLLTSDLKGYIEDPGYYYPARTSAVFTALDDLLLTQGWINYNISLSSPLFEAEKDYSIKGKVTNFFNKPVENSRVLLFSKTPSFVRDTLTNKDGHFTFTNMPMSDTTSYLLQARNKNGKSYNVNINVEQLLTPPFNEQKFPVMMPWYINTDSTMVNYIKKDAGIEELKYLPKSDHVLKEVKIVGKKVIKDSQNLNGPGNADEVIDEKQIVKAGKVNWLQLLEKTVQGFRFRTFFYANKTWYWYFVKDKWARVFVDGVEIDRVIPHPLIPYVLNFTQYLESKNAEDIKGIEVNFTSEHVVNYERRFGSYFDPTILQYAFIEITTYAGKGPLFGTTPGVYIYKPLSFSYPKQFYKPKYNFKDSFNNLLENRSTIDWEPNINTNSNGEATISFLLGKKVHSYTVVIDGIGTDGNLGYSIRNIAIK